MVLCGTKLLFYRLYGQLSVIHNLYTVN